MILFKTYYLPKALPQNTATLGVSQHADGRRSTDILLPQLQGRMQTLEKPLRLSPADQNTLSPLTLPCIYLSNVLS